MAESQVFQRRLDGLIGEYTERKVKRLEHLLGLELYRIIHGVFTNPLSIIGFTLIIFFILIAVFAPVIIAPNDNAPDPYKIRLPFWYETIMGTDQWVHIMGTAPGGWDIFYGVVWGTRTAIKVGIIIEGICLLLGTLIGSIAGFYGGVIDTVLMRIVEIFQTFPFILAAMTLSAILMPILGKGLWAATIALIVFGWMGYARLICGEILSVREREFITAARVVGASDSRIIFKHVIPNAIYPVLVFASLNIGNVVVAFATLSFLGIGTEIGYSDWGQLISFSRAWISRLSEFWWILIFPGIALVLFVLGWNLVGDALRDIMDPRMRN